MDKFLNISFGKASSVFTGLMFFVVGIINLLHPEEAAKPEKYKLFFTWESVTLVIIGTLLVVGAFLTKEKKETQASD